MRTTLLLLAFLQPTAGFCAVPTFGKTSTSTQFLSLVNRPLRTAYAPTLSVAAPPPEDTPPTAEPVSVQERLRLFWRLALPYFKTAEGAKLNAFLMFCLVLINNGVFVVFSFVGRDFYSALSARDQVLFLEKTANYAVILAVATPLTVLYKFQRQRLALNWRQWMTTELARQYYSDQAYYEIEVDPEIDNPDQRITEDVTAFTKVSLDFFITLTTSLINLVSFSGILYSIYPDLFYAIIGYAAFGTISTINLGKALVGQSAEQLLREADLRYALVRVRENAESIAFYQGEGQEAKEVTERLDAAIENRKKIIGTERNLEFFTVAYKYLVQILPVLVVSPLYFAGTIELGVITQSTGAFNNVLNDLSIIVSQFESLSQFSAGLTRLSTFVGRMESYQSYQEGEGNTTFVLDEEQLKRLNALNPQRTLWDYVRYGSKGNPNPPAPPALPGSPPPVEERSALDYIRYGTSGPPKQPPPSSPSPLSARSKAGRISNVECETMASGMALRVMDMSLFTPDGSRQLFANVSVDVRPGVHLLITGNSGAGKSSMLRAVAGLWNRGSGEVLRPLSADTMFLPQRPYCTLGSLRQQLVYPSTVEEWARTSTDESLLRVLRTVQLDRLADRGSKGLDEERDWGDELSLGEQQRLAFARVLVNKPKLCILDEATSALDLNNEAVMYTAIGKIPGISYVSVGHRPSLLRFHSQRLKLFGMGQSPSFMVEEVGETAAVESLEVSLML
jgi:ABC-type uncharacterized transport system fused permease/ATPase subunit